MEKSSKNIVIVAGEASGDIHAALLVAALKKKDPSLTFSGLGGPKMQQEGVVLLYDLTKLAVVGFFEVLKHYPQFKKRFDEVLNHIKTTNPDAVILVDYPGFNLRLAKEIKKLGIKVIYYISPQLWAWKESRIKIVKQCVDLMLVIFPFEVDFYRKHGVEAIFVGHPLLEHINSDLKPEKFRRSLNLDENKLTIGILPGSREKEVEAHLPVMLDAARIIDGEFPRVQYIILKASTVSQKTFDRFIPKNRQNIIVVDNQTYEGISASDICMVCSGTATLETAVLGKPMVIVYKTSFLTWILAKALIKIPHIGMVNVVAGKQIVPECVQYQATGSHIAQALRSIFTNELRVCEIRDELKKIKNTLGSHHAAETAAEKILTFLD